jgi:hypothetical protein
MILMVWVLIDELDALQRSDCFFDQLWGNLNAL